MPKLRKQRRRKVFHHNINRKRLRNKLYSVGKIDCKEIQNAWEQKKSLATNMKEMGLSYDPNETIKIPNNKSKLKTSLLSNHTEWQEEDLQDEQPEKNKSFVVEALEADAKAPRVKLLRLPKSHVEWVTYLMKKYGRDYKSMAKDRKNYNQETWKQIRQKIRQFKKIPEQYSVYLKENCLEASDSENDDKFDDDEL